MNDLDISFDDDISVDVVAKPQPPPVRTDEKRNSPRVRLENIWLRYEKRDLVIANISQTGAFVSTKLSELPVNGTFQCHIVAELFDTKICVPAKAQVVRHEKFRGYALRYKTNVEVWNRLFEKGGLTG
ncbi:MAG: PilZ domain-containing protein [Alphaproteobacteria bacterium]